MIRVNINKIYTSGAFNKPTRVSWLVSKDPDFKNVIYEMYYSNEFIDYLEFRYEGILDYDQQLYIKIKLIYEYPNKTIETSWINLDNYTIPRPKVYTKKGKVIKEELS